MINIAKAKIAFKDFLDKYEDKSDLGFELKIVHTYHVAENAKEIAEKLNLGKEDIELAELIGLLHDIGRFEELKITKELNSVKFDHAGHGSKMLFEKGMIRKFIEDNQYDNIIKKAIENHSRLEIEENLDERTLLHSKIIRDADKIDNYRVKKDEKIESIFPKRVNKIEDMEESKLSDIVYNTILDKKCVDIHDRVTPLDFWVCILAFTFDLNFDVSYKIIKENDYINVLVDRFEYKDKETKSKMENIRKIVNEFIDEKINIGENVMREIKIKGIYKHYKGDLYIVEDIIYHSETGEKMVAYRALYGDTKLWCRPYDMFLDEVNKNGQKYRFELQEIKSVKD